MKIKYVAKYFIFLIIFILIRPKKVKVFNDNKQIDVSNLVLMFTCRIIVFYQSPYVPDIAYPWYFCKWILLAMR